MDYLLSRSQKASELCGGLDAGCIEFIETMSRLIERQTDFLSRSDVEIAVYSKIANEIRIDVAFSRITSFDLFLAP